MATRIVELNNKGRKGKYIYIKEPGNPSRYYKYKEGLEAQLKEQYYKERYINKTLKLPKGKKLVKPKIPKFPKPKKSKQQQLQPQQKSQKSKKQARPIDKPFKERTPRPKQLRPLEPTIKPGRRRSVLRNALNASAHQVHKATMQMLKPAIADKQLLELISTEENMKKLVHRLEFKVELFDNEGKRLGEFSHMGSKTLQHVIAEISQTLRKGMDWYTDGSDAINQLKERNYSFSPGKNKGKLKEVTVTMTFRKNR